MTEQDFLSAYYQIKAILGNVFKQLHLDQMFFFQQLMLQAYLQDTRNDYYTKQAISPGMLNAEPENPVNNEENVNDQPESSLNN